MSKLVLHIGTMKTGSSALQSFFLRNREVLARQGVAYPLFGSQGNATEERNGVVLRRLVHNRVNGVDPATRIERYDQCKATWETLSSEQGTILLSDELIFTNEIWLLDNGTKSLAAEFWSRLCDVVAEIGVSYVEVVVYLRRQDRLAASLWKQFMRSGNSSLSFQEYLIRPNNLFYLDYAATVKTIDRQLGDFGHVVPRRYDRGRFYGGDIYHDFCHATGIRWDSSFEVPRGDTNLSLSYDVAEAIRHVCTGTVRVDKRRSLAIAKAEELSRENPDPPGMSPFTEEEARVLVESFQEGNRWIARHYLGEETLFDDDYAPAAVWVPNEERIASYLEQIRHAYQEG